MSVGLVEVEAKTPIVIVSKRAKGGFLETTEYIPSSTILGGVARKTVKNNHSKGFGNCANLKGPNEFPKCETCNAKERCTYNSIWIEKRLKLSYYFPFDQKNFKDPPPIPNLQSLFKSREEELFVDGLLLMALYKLSLKKLAKEETLLERIETKSGPCKKSESSVYIQDNKIETLKIKINDSPHVAINHQFKTSETGYLYSHTAISRGTKFTGLAIGDEENIDALNGEISIGTGKSRGNGIVGLRVKNKESLKDFISMRTEAIMKGFEEIRNKMINFLEEPQRDLLFGTVTGLSPLPLNGSMPFDAVGKRINIPPNQIVHLSYKGGIHIRYEFNDEKNSGPNFILSSVINPGYAGVFYIKGDLEEVSLNLAKVETKMNNYHPWFGWVTINHPIHYEFGNGVGGE
ncbi:MAG: RAMP superfamily CRISPR-associated protein [Candidatus Jordarchaeum sp.]|uniref:RAMP superfamily CRISPR-associated protein n=1 Tax=Candidatus Jordarchaeum sp. TaxID=2823881 RepID=UPI00404B8028